MIKFDDMMMIMVMMTLLMLMNLFDILICVVCIYKHVVILYSKWIRFELKTQGDDKRTSCYSKCDHAFRCLLL